MRIILLFGEMSSPDSLSIAIQNDSKCTIKSKQSPKAHPIEEGFTKSWKVIPKKKKQF